MQYLDLERGEPAAGLPRRTASKMATSALALSFAGLTLASPALSQSCEGLTSLALDNTRISSAEKVPVGAYTGGNCKGALCPTGDLPAHCRVKATISPNPGSRTEIEVWLPEKWNGRLQAIGNHGLAGKIYYVDLGEALKRGYTTVGTDEGHSAGELATGDTTENFKAMLANGITGFRQMSGSPELLARRAAGEDLTPGAAPDLLIMPGAILNAGNVPTPAAAVALVDQQKAAGADFIKTLVSNPAVYLATLDEAARIGIPVAAHLPPTVSAELAAAKGIDAIEHLGPRESLLLSASTKEAAFRKEIAETPPPPPPVKPPTPGDLARSLANPIPGTTQAQFDRMFARPGTFDPQKARALSKVLIDDQVWQTPTLIRLRTMEFGDAAIYRSDPNLAYATQADRDLWQDIGRTFAADLPPGTKPKLAEFFDLQLRLTKLFADEGVPMMAGSDYGGQWVTPGFSLHQEFDLLDAAGLSPLQVLQMTTLNAGRFLGREDDIGNVAEGDAGRPRGAGQEPAVRRREPAQHRRRVQGRQFFRLRRPSGAPHARRRVAARHARCRSRHPGTERGAASRGRCLARGAPAAHGPPGRVNPALPPVRAGRISQASFTTRSALMRGG